MAVRIVNGEIVRGPAANAHAGPPAPSLLKRLFTPVHRPVVLVFLALLLTCQLVVIDDVHDHFFGTDRDGKPIVTINAACQAYVAYVLGPSWVPSALRSTAARLCDPFNVEPLRLPATELAWHYEPPPPCDEGPVHEAGSYATSRLLGWARRADRYGGGDWLRHLARVVDDAVADTRSGCQAWRRHRLCRHYRAVVVGGASALLVAIAHVLVVSTCLQLLDAHAHLLAGGCALVLLPALAFAGLLDVDWEDRDRNGRFDGRWATGTVVLVILTAVVAWTMPDQHQPAAVRSAKDALLRLLRLF